MATQAMPTIPGAGGADKAQQLPAADNPLAFLLPLLTQSTRGTTTTGGTGDVAGLQQLLATLMPTTTAAGMNPVIQAIFQQGFQNQMPAIYNAANQAGLRPSSTTQQQLLVNDLTARLTAEAAKAVNQQQQTAGQVATAIAQNTKTPTVTKQTDKQSINANNALLGAALLTGAKLISGLGKGSTSSTTPAIPTPAKKTASRTMTPEEAMVLGYGQSTAGDLITGLLGGADFMTPSLSTGGINPNAVGSSFASTGDISWNPFSNSSPNAAGDPTLNFITNMLSGQDFGTSASGAAGRYATAAIPVVGPYVAAAQTVGDLLGVNEITGITNSITNTIGDIGSALVSPFGCYITTAVCELQGKPDDCHELQTLRKFRDEWLVKQPGGEELVAQYYEQAPRFLAAVSKSGFREQMLRNFDEVYIKPAVHAVEAGDNAKAFRIYTDMLQDANNYINHMER